MKKVLIGLVISLFCFGLVPLSASEKKKEEVQSPETKPIETKPEIKVEQETKASFEEGEDLEEN